jgi:hypothetical protein
MNTVKTTRYDWRAEGAAPAQIIDIRAHRRTVSRRKNSGGDLFWNVLFVGLCLSVLIVLFFH